MNDRYRDRDDRGGSGRDRARGDDRDDRGSRGRGDDRDDRGRGSDRGGRDDRGSTRTATNRAAREFVYQQRDPESAHRRSESRGDFDVFIKEHVKTFKVNDRDNNVRIVPPTWDKPEHYGLDIYVHYRVGPDKQSYLCLHKMKGEPCPICDERGKALAQGDEEYARSLAPTRRVLVYLVDRDNRRDGVQAWAMPQTLDQNIVKVSVDKTSGEVIPIDDPEEGYDVFFEKKGSQRTTEYVGVQVARRSSPLDEPDALDFAMDNPLPDQLVYYSYDHIAKEFGGGGAGVRRDDDRDDRARGDDRGGRGRGDDRDDRGRGRDHEDERPARGGRDRDGDRGSNRRQEPEYTWDTVHSMTGRELRDLVEDQRLKINPKEAKDDQDLADWVCEEMKLDKPTTRPGRVSDDRGQDSPDDRLRRMREERDRR